jgi:chemotaxis protein CheX
MGDLIDSEVIIDILRRVTSDVLSTMLNVEARTEEPYTEHHAPNGSGGVMSFVGLTGTECVGTGSLQCESDAACRLASLFLMSEFEAVDDEVLDAFGELANMIVGNFKNEAEQHMGPMALSVPTVIHGKNFTTRSLGQEEWTVVPFLCGDDRLSVKICLKPKAAVGPSLRAGERQEFILGH